MSGIKEQISLLKRDIGFLEERIERHDNVKFQPTASEDKAIIRYLKKARNEVSNAMNKA